MHDYFNIDESGISNNVIVKAVLAIDNKLPKDALINNGLDGYIKQVAKAKSETPATVREQIMKQIKADVNRFVRLEQLEIAGVARDDSLMRAHGTVHNPQNNPIIVEGPSEFRDAINRIALRVDKQKRGLLL